MTGGIADLWNIAVGSGAMFFLCGRGEGGQSSLSLRETVGRGAIRGLV